MPKWRTQDQQQTLETSKGSLRIFFLILHNACDTRTTRLAHFLSFLFFALSLRVADSLIGDDLRQRKSPEVESKGPTGNIKRR